MRFKQTGGLAGLKDQPGLSFQFACSPIIGLTRRGQGGAFACPTNTQEGMASKAFIGGVWQGQSAPGDVRANLRVVEEKVREALAQVGASLCETMMVGSVGKKIICDLVPNTGGGAARLS